LGLRDKLSNLNNKRPRQSSGQEEIKELHSKLNQLEEKLKMLGDSDLMDATLLGKGSSSKKRQKN
jgi:hypothetical protein